MTAWPLRSQTARLGEPVPPCVEALLAFTDHFLGRHLRPGPVVRLPFERLRSGVVRLSSVKLGCTPQHPRPAARRSRAGALAGLGRSRADTFRVKVPWATARRDGFRSAPTQIHSPMSRTQIASPLHSRELSPGLPGAFIFQLHSQLPEPRNSLRLLQSMESNFVVAQSSGHKGYLCTSSRSCSHILWKRSLSSSKSYRICFHHLSALLGRTPLYCTSQASLFSDSIISTADRA